MESKDIDISKEIDIMESKKIGIMELKEINKPEKEWYKIRRKG